MAPVTVTVKTTQPKPAVLGIRQRAQVREIRQRIIRLEAQIEDDEAAILQMLYVQDELRHNIRLTRERIAASINEIAQDVLRAEIHKAGLEGMVRGLELAAQLIAA